MKKLGKTLTIQLKNEELNIVIDPFVLHIVFHHVGISETIEKNNDLIFEMAVMGRQWMDKSPWYNTNICTEWNGQILGDNFWTGRKDRYEFMCRFDLYEKYHVSLSYDDNSVGGIPMPNTSSKELLFSLCQIIDFIDNLL